MRLSTETGVSFGKSPLSPLCPPGQRPYGPAAKEGEYLSFVKEGFVEIFPYFRNFSIHVKSYHNILCCQGKTVF
ncbi:MAG: hypothetical protein A2V86_02480 [Deltaproteobacteria bacterium RBG_16_49_23]|nr:MAG: hypothetical protein A2V86_02480 [Deltaproteobacteria bacterium RBG_16_49_23]